MQSPCKDLDKVIVALNYALNTVIRCSLQRVLLKDTDKTY